MKKEDVSKFFALRAEKLSTPNPLSAVMYQDSNPGLAVARDVYEREKLLPKILINSESRLLDYGCGTARLGTHFAPVVSRYIGIDPNPDFIKYANTTLSEFSNVSLMCGDIGTLDGLSIVPNRIILGGVTQYLDNDELTLLLEKICGYFKNSIETVILYLRTSISRGSEFELNQIWSEELNSHYSAIYRNQQDMERIIATHFEGHATVDKGEAFPQELGNRVETTQYYWIIQSA